MDEAWEEEEEEEKLLAMELEGMKLRIVKRLHGRSRTRGAVWREVGSLSLPRVIITSRASIHGQLEKTLTPKTPSTP